MKGSLSKLNKELHSGKSKEKKPKSAEQKLETNIPRGERADFLKVTITMPVNLLSALRAEGMRRKANGDKDTDVSSLIREGMSSWLNNQ